MSENEQVISNKSKSEELLKHIEQTTVVDNIVDVEEDRVQIIIFYLVGMLFGIYGRDAKEVLTVDKITAVPGCPDYIVGIINIRGDAESVIDLNLFLHLPPEENEEKMRVIIAQHGSVRSGIRVKAIVDVVDIPESSLHSAISTLSESVKDFVVGETSYKGENVTILDAGKILEKMATE